MQKLSLLDAAFLMLERREQPMHVGGLHLFTLPEGVDDQTFLHGLADNMRTADAFQAPFGDRLKFGRLGAMGPIYWEPDPALDLDYHIRHSALPKPGRFRELFALVSRLHGSLMDRHRPLWEMHLIEGLQNRQFAVYSKFHHAAIDGARSMHLTNSMYSTDPDEQVNYSPLSVTARERYLQHLHVEPPTEGELGNVADALKATFDSGVHMTGALRRFVGAWMGRESDLEVPFRHVPPSSINTEVDGARRFVAQSWPFARIRAVGKALDGTFNDAVLAMCAGALRTYLLNHGELPTESLKSMVPVSLRRAGDLDSANAVAAITADLATNVRDPEKRYRTIKASMEAGKSVFRNLSARESQLFVQLTSLPGLVLVPLGLASKFPPYSTTISNVPGPRDPLYWNGARLEGMYPVSIVAEGMALNITLVTYDDHVDFGIIACRRSLPQVQRLIDYLEDSLVELEEVVGLTPGGAGIVSRRQSRAGRATGGSGASKVSAKTKAKTKTKAKAKAKTKTKAKTKARSKTKAGTKSQRAATAGKRTPRAVRRKRAPARVRPKTAAAQD